MGFDACLTFLVRVMREWEWAGGDVHRRGAGWGKERVVVNECGY